MRKKLAEIIIKLKMNLLLFRFYFRQFKLPKRISLDWKKSFRLSFKIKFPNFIQINSFSFFYNSSREKNNASEEEWTERIVRHSGRWAWHLYIFHSFLQWSTKCEWKKNLLSSFFCISFVIWMTTLEWLQQATSEAREETGGYQLLSCLNTFKIKIYRIPENLHVCSKTKNYFSWISESKST